MVKILVIDDDADIRECVVEIIENAGFKVFSAPDGDSGIKVAENISPDLILCDIAMPNLDGIEVIKRIMSDSRMNNIPFIFLTAKAELKDIREGMQLGADDYITKPFKASDLIKSIKSRLNRINTFKTKKLEKLQRFSYDQKVFLSEEKMPRFIRISDIVAITADYDYTNVFLRDGTKVYQRRLLKEWNVLLPENHFFRIHRSTIINLESIEKVEKWFKRSFKIYMKYIDQSFISSERYTVEIKKVFKI